MADTSVKLIHSGMTGAPTLANVAGNLVSVLNAALVDGFGLNAVDSLVIAGGVATVTRAAGHPFDTGAVALVSGATTTTGSVNGEQRVLAVTATTYTFDATGISNQTATGTISHRVAPLGWGRPFAGSSTLQVYRSTDVTGTRMYLQVNDTGTTNARVVGYEAMTTDSAGTGPFPTAAQLSGGNWWPKANAAGSKPWMIVGDGKLFYLWVQFNPSLGAGISHTSAFGDFTSRKSPDPFGCILTGTGGDIVASGSPATTDWSYTNTGVSQCYVARGVSGFGSSGGIARLALNPRGFQNLYSGEASSNHIAFPNAADNSLFLVPFVLVEAACYRGDAPGVFFLPHNVGPSVFAIRDRITGVTGYAGRTFTAFPSPVGVTFFDTTGPWR